MNAVWSVLFAVCTWNAVGVSSTPSDDWKVDSALFKVPSAEICVLTACVCVEISDCCGAAVAATSCDTSELTLMTEPPAASALELLAINLYVLAGLARRGAGGISAGLGYLVLGAASSAILLYGLAVIFGLAGLSFA